MRSGLASVARLSLPVRREKDGGGRSASLDGGAAHGTEWPASPGAYEIISSCGHGVSGTVHLAYCRVARQYVAVKAVNLEALAPEHILREVAVMRSYRCRSILQLHCSFVAGQELWMVMPYCEGGSVAHIMRYRFKDGLAEAVIATIAREVLLALDYIHAHSGIHRDVKAGNILIGEDGRTLLGDFGVSATMERDGDWGGSGPVTRRTCVGTPCWMAPEVMLQEEYGPPSDIWSLGITLLEMAHGAAPFAKYPPMKVLMMTLQGPPPQLEAQRGCRQFSKAMREVVALCLQKDPALRPTAKQLLQHRFFRQARDAAFVRRELLADLPPLPRRLSEIRAGSVTAATCDRDNVRREAASQASYASSVAHWDFKGMAPATDDAAPESDTGAYGACSSSAGDTMSDGGCSSIHASGELPPADAAAALLMQAPPPGLNSAAEAVAPLPCRASTSQAGSSASNGVDGSAGGGSSASGGIGGGMDGSASGGSAPVKWQAVAGVAQPSAAGGPAPPVSAEPRAKRLGRFSLVEGAERYAGPHLVTHSVPLAAASNPGPAQGEDDGGSGAAQAASGPAALQGGEGAQAQGPLHGSGVWRRRARQLLPWLAAAAGARQPLQDGSAASGGLKAQGQPGAGRRLLQRPRSFVVARLGSASRVAGQRGPSAAPAEAAAQCAQDSSSGSSGGCYRSSCSSGVSSTEGSSGGGRSSGGTSTGSCTSGGPSAALDTGAHLNTDAPVPRVEAPGDVQAGRASLERRQLAQRPKAPPISRKKSERKGRFRVVTQA